MRDYTSYTSDNAMILKGPPDQCVRFPFPDLRGTPLSTALSLKFPRFLFRPSFLRRLAAPFQILTVRAVVGAIFPPNSVKSHPPFFECTLFSFSLARWRTSARHVTNPYPLLFAGACFLHWRFPTLFFNFTPIEPSFSDGKPCLFFTDRSDFRLGLALDFFRRVDRLAPPQRSSHYSDLLTGHPLALFLSLPRPGVESHGKFDTPRPLNLARLSSVFYSFRPRQKGALPPETAPDKKCFSCFVFVFPHVLFGRLPSPPSFRFFGPPPSSFFK